jgi:hypothetical protein
MFQVIDWAGNLMNWGDFSSFEDASECIDRKVEQELINDGLNPFGEWCDCPENFTREATDEDFSEYRGEYSIE